jgi:hypothetical protein
VHETGSDSEGDISRAQAGGAGSCHEEGLPARGLLRLSRFDVAGATEHPSIHRAAYVNGPDYCGMTDNDIRGFLDGGFIWGWNQATQIHVRLGRTGEFPHPKYGENEVFRVLQRWSNIALPQDAELSACRLTLHVEEGPPHPLRLLVYAVARDWNPGSGGVDGNNVSTPKPGEVWWGDAAYGQEGWGLPGAAFASDSHPEADTGVHALADATWNPEQDRLVFQSAALTAYASDRISRGEPVLLLLKLADAHEDLPGCFLNLYSGEHGDSRNTIRRPKLDLQWSSSAEAECVAHDVFLEYGRVCDFPRQPSGKETWAASFEREEGYRAPTLQVRHGTGDSAGPWRTASYPFEGSGDWFQVRLLAMPDPVALGDTFEAELADTWVLTGPPEKQSVPWIFESPTGVIHKVEAEYSGQYRWRISFKPDEPGRWQYHWTQEFLPEPYRSATGEFHVWGATLDAVVEHLARLAEAVASTARADRHGLYLQLHSLQREGMRLLEPDAYRSAAGEELRAAIRRVRSALWGKPVPEVIPMESHQLVRELEGVELRDPIPEGTSYGPSDRASRRSPLLRTALRRWKRRFTRLAGRQDRESR